MPPWPKGRGIEDTCGYLAGMTLFVAIGSSMIGAIWPDLGGKTATEFLISMGIALLLGAVWLSLRLERLRWARAALIANCVLLVVAMTAGMAHGLRKPITGSGEAWEQWLFLAIIAPLLLFWWAQGEVAREIKRRHPNAKS